jgi:hypothetical protein
MRYDYAHFCCMAASTNVQRMQISYLGICCDFGLR